MPWICVCGKLTWGLPRMTFYAYSLFLFTVVQLLNCYEVIQLLSFVPGDDDMYMTCIITRGCCWYILQQHMTRLDLLNAHNSWIWKLLYHLGPLSSFYTCVYICVWICVCVDGWVPTLLLWMIDQRRWRISQIHGKIGRNCRSKVALLTTNQMFTFHPGGLIYINHASHACCVHTYTKAASP